VPKKIILCIKSKALVLSVALKKLLDYVCNIYHTCRPFMKETTWKSIDVREKKDKEKSNAANKNDVLHFFNKIVKSISVRAGMNSQQPSLKWSIPSTITATSLMALKMRTLLHSCFI